MPTLPILRIVPSPDLVPHEWHDDQRSKPLVERLRASGVLRNPPMVTPLPDGSGRYMVLDGANRTSALTHMGIPHALVQVVEADSPGLDLHTWNHVLWDWDGDEFLAALGDLPDVTLRDIDPSVKKPQSRWPLKTLVWVQTQDGQAYVARSVPGDLASRTRALNKITELYAKKAVIDRTTAQQVRELADKSLEEKNAALQQWVNERTARKGVRYYAEPTVLYDE